MTNDTVAVGLKQMAGRREWTGLAVLALPLLLVSMDVSVLYFAVPFISADLAPSATQQLWIFDIYGFVLAGLLLTMGSLGDRIGRRKLLLIGAVGFSLASIGAAYSQSAEMLIGARALLGVAGATLMPSTLGLIRNMFHDAKQRSTAIAIWTAVMTSGIALGPVLSGFLLEHFWWGSIFLINIPAMVLLLMLGPVLLPEYRTPGRGRFDLVSSGLSLAAVLPAIYGIKEWAAQGFSVDYLACVLVGVGIGVAFVLRQQRIVDPMLDLSLFAGRQFSGSVLVNTVAMFALVGNAVFLTQFLQSVLGHDAVCGGAVESGPVGVGRRRCTRRGPAGPATRSCVCDGRRICPRWPRFRAADPGATDVTAGAAADRCGRVERRFGRRDDAGHRDGHGGDGPGEGRIRRCRPRDRQ